MTRRPARLLPPSLLRACLLPAALLLAAALLGGCGDDGTRASDAGRAATPELPDGWRWESYAGVQVGVPGDFGWTTSGQRIGQWCIGDEDPAPAVGRPGFSTLVGCPEGDPDPATLMENTGTVVAFDTASEDDPTATDQGDQSVLRIGDVLLRVIGPPELREQVLATAHETDVDAKGCSMRLPSGAGAGAAPSPALDVSTLEGVDGVSACRYSTNTLDPGAPAPLLSSLRREGEAAADIVEAIAAAPVGGGPDRPENCTPEYSYGDEFIVVQVDSDQGRSVLHAYYSGCDHNGFDDGTTMRSLTREAIQPLIADANRPGGWSGGAGKTEMLQP